MTVSGECYLGSVRFYEESMTGTVEIARGTFPCVVRLDGPSPISKLTSVAVPLYCLRYKLKDPLARNNAQLAEVNGRKLEIFLSPREHEIVDAVALARGLTRAQAIRRIILESEKVPKRRPAVG